MAVKCDICGRAQYLHICVSFVEDAMTSGQA
jgi:hypothetical protein